MSTRLLFAALLALLLGLTVALSGWLERQILFPAPRVPQSWLAEQAARWQAEELALTAEDGTRLYGWWVPGGGEAVVVFFHGNGSTVGGRPDLYERLPAAGFDVLHVAYRGYPGSEGEPDEPGLRMDARAAWAEAVRRLPEDRIVLMGNSLGGGVAIGLAAEHDPRALVLTSTFTSALQVGQDHYPRLPVAQVLSSHFDSLALASKVRAPTLIVHGGADTLIAPSHASALAAAFPTPPPVVIVPGRDHNDGVLDDPTAWSAFLEIASADR